MADLLERARLQFVQTQQKARLFDDVYYAAGTWDAPRRLVMKAEWLPKGANPRFVLTNLDLPPQQLYDQFYVQRGSDSEDRIKELKLGIHADRLSCSSFIANLSCCAFYVGRPDERAPQFRLLLSQAAYILLLRIRQAADGTEFATAQVERLRSMLIKRCASVGFPDHEGATRQCAAKVTVSARRVLVELARHSPFAAVISQISSRLQGCEVVSLY
jgi:hypothetical protein